MDGLSPLLAHHAKTNPPLPDKRNHMVLSLGVTQLSGKL
jgi:hypothetical protein